MLTNLEGFGDWTRQSIFYLPSTWQFILYYEKWWEIYYTDTQIMPAIDKHDFVFHVYNKLLL